MGAALTMGANADIARAANCPGTPTPSSTVPAVPRLVTPSTRLATLRRRSGPGIPQSLPQTPTLMSRR